MRTIIHTDSDTELSIQVCKTTVTNHLGTYPVKDQLCLMLHDIEKPETFEGENTLCSFLTKDQVLGLANRLKQVADQM